MNHESDTPLTPVGDDALEARIVAWVLGEASSFEAAELEKLCAGDPALRRFEQRIRDLHGLLGEDAKAGPDAEWKLPQSKRAMITDLLGTDVVKLVPERAVNRYFTRRILLAAAACLMISVIAYSSFGPLAGRKEGVGSTPLASNAVTASAPRIADAATPGPERIESLRRAVQMQEDAVEDKRRLLSQITRQEGPIDKGKQSVLRSSGSNEAADFENASKALLALQEINAKGDEGALALNDTRSSRRKVGTVPPPAAAARPSSAAMPEQELPEIAEAKKSQAGVGGATGWGGRGDALADSGPSEADADGFASVAELSAGQSRVRKNMTLPSEELAKGESKSDLATIVPEPAAAPEAPGGAERSKELTDLAAGMSVAPAVTPSEPGLLAGKEVHTRFGREAKSEAGLGLSSDAPVDPSVAASDFLDLQKMGEAADHLKTAPRPALVLGGELRTKDSEPVSPTQATSFESSGRLDLSEQLDVIPLPPGTGAESLSLAPSQTQWFSSRDDKPAKKPVAEVELNIAQSLERAKELQKVGKYEEVRQIADAALAADPNNIEAKRLRGYQEDPVATNPALPYGSLEKGDQVRRTLYAAEGHYNLGKYDEASRAYEDALRIDPINKAARRGIERAALAKTDYYRAAYDHTRAELLGQVDKAWESSVPPGEEKQQELAEEGTKVGDGGYSDLAQKEMIRRQDAVAQSDQLRDEGRQAYADGNYKQAIDKYKESIQVLPDAPMVKDRRVYLGQLLSDGATALGEQHVKAGDKAKARELAVGILAVDPGNPGAKALLLDEKPKPDEKSDETSAAAQPFSTFSLHVSDASFKLAKAALERGEQPDPASIRPEEFYNAFDYGDPAPGRGEPVACALEQSANPVIPQRNLVRIGIRAGSSGRGQSTPLNLTLLLDSSGSMEREDRHQGMAMAVQQLAGLLKEGDTVSVIGFSRQPRLLVDRLPGTRAQELNVLLAQTPSEGGTNLEEGLKLAEELAKRQFNAAAQNRIVLFTDGAANLGDAQPETLQARIETMRQDGIAFDAAGFGTDGLNDKLLERLTRNGNGRYYIVDRPEDADANFAKQLAGAFRPAAENVKVQVRFNPARVGKYKLIGFEEHRLNKEDFRNDAVDAAEMAAEEAGNALYQIEPLPGGEGEIGEVSVRFRDAASGEMVERTWTIPYEAQAPAFDLAPPSIQLAALSAFAAEKLRKAPMAEAIDFQQLGPILAKVKARYPNSQSVSDLGAMIGKLK